jgi:hypothetical protein
MWFVVAVIGSNAVAQQPTVEQLWNDFMHYTRIARLDLAISSGQALLQRDADPASLLSVIEQSPYAENWEKVLLRASTMESDDKPEQAEQLAGIARQVEKTIREAQKAVVRDSQRIREAIERLDDGQRAYLNAVALLKEAGEYAAPRMIDVLLSREQVDQTLRPYVLSAAVEVGRPLVIPFSESLLNLPPVAKQQVSQVLARIGYPATLPYLKHISQRNDLPSDTVRAAALAFDAIAARVPGVADQSPAQLFRGLGEDYYAGNESLILQPDAETNLMWSSDQNGRLTSTAVPTPIFDDVLAMRAARRALDLEPDMAKALSLWVRANFRRDNQLPAGETDPTYGPDMRSPQFYARLAGPRHLSPVLARALEDADAALALDAIDALAATAGHQTLAGEDEGGSPLLAAMDYPDRRVRFEAAFAVARARPGGQFSGAGRVVPVLASAVRQSGRQVAVVLAADQNQLNQLADRVRQAGQFQLISGTKLTEVSQALLDVAAADLIVVQMDPDRINTIYPQIRQNYKLRGAAMVALSSDGGLASLNRMFVDDALVLPTDAKVTDEQLTARIDQALSIVGGGQIDDAQALAYATEAVNLLRDLAITGQQAFNVIEARRALTEALDDNRRPVAIGAAEVLAQLADDQAQVALADVALDETRPADRRIAFLGSLAASARRIGNRLTDRHNDLLGELVNQASGDLADAAAQAYGALNLPTGHSVQLIVQ